MTNTILNTQYTENIIETSVLNKNKGKNILGAFGWFGLFAISSIVLIPALMILGCLLDWDFVVDGTYAIADFMEAVYAGNFSLEGFDMTTIIAASNLTLASLLVSYIPIVVMMFIRRDVEGGFEKIDLAEALKWMAIITGANFVLEVIMVFFTEMPFFAEQTNTLASVGILSTAGNPLLALLATGIMAPICEEITLRRGIQNNLCKINPTFGIVAASVIFGVMHGNLFQGVFAALMGLILGYAYYKTNNLWYSTLMHIAVNLSAVLITLAGVNQYVAYGIIPVVLGVMYFIVKNTKSN